jgi:hypothetical protein
MLFACLKPYRDTLAWSVSSKKSSVTSVLSRHGLCRLFSSLNVHSLRQDKLPSSIDGTQAWERLKVSGGATWTEEESNRLKELRLAGKPIKDIHLAEFPYRSYGSVQAKCARLIPRYYSTEEMNTMLDMRKCGYTMHSVQQALPFRTMDSIRNKYYLMDRGRSLKQRSGWTIDMNTLLAELHAQGKTTRQIQRHAFSDRSIHDISQKLTKLYEQGISTPRYRVFAFGNAEFKNIVNLHSQGLSPEAIARQHSRTAMSIRKKLQSLGYKVNPAVKPKLRHWGLDEDAIVEDQLNSLEITKRLDYMDLARKLPGRTYEAIARRAALLQRRRGVPPITKARKWTEESTLELCELYAASKQRGGQKMILNDVAAILGRTLPAIMMKLRRLGLTAEPPKANASK